MVIKDIIIKNARRYPNKTAVVLEDTRCTFEELNNRANKLANALIDMGVNKGDRVAVLVDSCLPYAELLCASQKCGAVVVPLNPGMDKRGLVYITNDIEANTFLLGENYIDLYNSLSEEIRGVRNLISMGAPSGVIKGYEELVSQYPLEEPEVKIDELDTCFIDFTSGTTGLPKGVVSTNRRYLASMQKTAYINHLTHGDTMLIPMPSFWMAGIMYACLYCGCTSIITREYDPKTILETIEREKITNAIMPPFYITSLLEYPRLKEYKLPSLERIVLMGASLPAEILKRATEVFGNILTQTYGTSEASWLTFLSPGDIVFKGPPEKVKRLQSCGKELINTELRVVDENDNDVLPGQIGELIARGGSVIKEYWKLPQTTAETFRGGYMYTGDMATVDEEGYIYLAGRKKDIVSSGAEIVYPTEIEEVLHRHPGILEATVIGIPDVELGEVVKAVVVLREGQETTEEEMIGFCRQYLAGHAIPESVDIIDKLPRTASGKILKRELKERYSNA